MHSPLQLKPSLTAGEAFHHLHLLCDRTYPFTEREKYLMGLGYIPLQDGQFDLFCSLLKKLDPALEHEVIKAMHRVVEEGLSNLAESTIPLSDDQLSVYWELAEKFRKLRSTILQ